MTTCSLSLSLPLWGELIAYLLLEASPGFSTHDPVNHHNLDLRIRLVACDAETQTGIHWGIHNPDSTVSEDLRGRSP